MKPLFLIVIELNGKHKENGCQFISYMYLYAKKTQMWLGNTSLQFLFCKDFQSPTERSRASSLSPSLRKKKSLKNIIQFRMTVLKKKSVYFYIFLL